MRQPSCRTNEERTEEGLTPLAQNTLLDLAARLKAEDMATKGYYAHIAPDGTTPMDFVSRAGYRYRLIGENLVVQRTSAKQVVDAFMGSPGHRTNILRKDFTEIGVGTAKGLYKGEETTFTVQIFAAPQVPVQSSKENVKPISNTPKVPDLPKAPIVATVPRPQSAAKPPVVTAPPPVKAATTTLSIAPLDEKVKEILKPLAPLIEIATTSTTSQATSTPVLYTPSFSFKAPTFVSFNDVSRLEVQTPETAKRSTWKESAANLWNGLVAEIQSWF